MPRRSVVGRAALVAGLVLGASACQNAGADRVAFVGATGVVDAQVFFDQDGGRTRDAADPAMSGVHVQLTVAGTRDTVAGGLTDGTGLIRFPRVPVGTYDVIIDAPAWADTIGLVRHDSATIVIGPSDSTALSALVSYPTVTVAEARALPDGRKVFVEGVALNAIGTFGDNTVHFGSASGAIRGTRVRPRAYTVGDSVRALGTRRATDGQATLDDVTILVLNSAAIPIALRVTTQEASTADGGVLDAALVKVVDARITDTMTVGGDYLITATDGSGPVVVAFDGDAGLTRTLFVPNAIADFTGLLVPTGGATWRLKPRTNADNVFKAVATVQNGIGAGGDH